MPPDSPIGLSLRLDRLTEDEVDAAMSEYGDALSMFNAAAASIDDRYRIDIDVVVMARSSRIQEAQRRHGVAVAEINARYARESEVAHADQT